MRSPSINFQYKRDGETVRDGLMQVMIKPATAVFVTHLDDQIVYHYCDLIKLTFVEG